MPSPVFVPARNYSWPPAGPGNTLAVRHAAFTPRVYEPLAQEMLAEALAARPDWEPYAETVAAACRFRARAALLDKWLTEHGLFNSKDAIREGPLRWWAQFERQAAALLASLGADPTSEARLAKDRAEATATAFDLEAVRDRGRQAREAAQLAQEPRPLRSPADAPTTAQEAGSGPHSAEVNDT